MHRDEASAVDSSGLFDRDWYLASYAQAGGAAEDPVTHFCRNWSQDFQPNPYFHPTWYARTYAAEFRPGENPLLHYIRRGERENAWPSPHFDPEWYRNEYAIGESESPLRHYLRNRGGGAFSPLPVFDAAAYTAAHPQWSASAQDPYLHSLQHREEEQETVPRLEWTLATVLHLAGGNPETASLPDTVGQDAFVRVLRLFIPLIPFDATWYCNNYPDIAAALRSGAITSAHQHFLEHGFFEGRSPAAPGGGR